MNDKCWFCGKEYTVKEQKEAGVVFCPNPEGRIACHCCWDNFVCKLKGILKYITLPEILGYNNKGEVSDITCYKY